MGKRIASTSPGVFAQSLLGVVLCVGIGTAQQIRLLPPPEALPAPRQLDSPQLQGTEERLQWIDLPAALKLADAQNPQIGLARERIREAMALQDAAHVLWLPNLEFNPTWNRHDGQIQRASGEVITVSRSSLFVGGGARMSWPLSDNLFANLAARQVTAGRQAGAAAVANDRLLDVALAYIDLLQAYGEVQISTEAQNNARELLKITENYEAVGKGAAADTARARTEADGRQRDILLAQARANYVASARLVRLVNLPADLELRPADPAVVPLVLVPEQIPVRELIAQGLSNRPEAAENAAYAQASYERYRAARWSPFVPDLRLDVSAGGFGGGINDFFGDFDGREDVTAMAVWRLNQLGFGNHAEQRRRLSQYEQMNYRQADIAARIGEQVVAAHAIAEARRQQLVSAQSAVAAARDSYRLNLERIRRAPEQSRPIELLQAIQALARARFDYLQIVADFNRAQFRLYAALGNPPQCALDKAAQLPLSESVVP